VESISWCIFGQSNARRDRRELVEVQLIVGQTRIAKQRNRKVAHHDCGGVTRGYERQRLLPVLVLVIVHKGAKVGETIHLAQMDHGQVLFVDKLKTIDQFETLAQTGKIAPGYCTGVGKAILAFLPPERRQRALMQQAFMQYTPATHTDAQSLADELDEIRKEGVAFDREEHERGIISIAAPIITDGGRVIGSMSIATSTARHSLKGLNKFCPALLNSAEKIGVDAAYWHFP